MMHSRTINVWNIFGIKTIWIYGDSVTERMHDFIFKAKESGKDMKYILTNAILFNELHIEESCNKASLSIAYIICENIATTYSMLEMWLDRFDQYELFQDIGNNHWELSCLKRTYDRIWWWWFSSLWKIIWVKCIQRNISH